MEVAINCSRWFTMTMVTMAMAMATDTGTGTDTDMDMDTMTAPMLTWNVSLATSATGQAKRGIILQSPPYPTIISALCVCV